MKSVLHQAIAEESSLVSFFHVLLLHSLQEEALIIIKVTPMAYLDLIRRVFRNKLKVLISLKKMY